MAFSLEEMEKRLLDKLRPKKPKLPVIRGLSEAIKRTKKPRLPKI